VDSSSITDQAERPYISPGHLRGPEGATFADGDVNPITKKCLIHPAVAQYALAVMTSPACRKSRAIGSTTSACRKGTKSGASEHGCPPA
jgi:hypothetical protein